MNISLTRLASFYSGLRTPLLLHAMLKREFPGSVAVLTGFDAETALLLDHVAQIDPSVPVLFPDTGRHSAETLDYAATLTRHLRLTNVRRPQSLEETLEELGSLALITGRLRENHPGLEAFELDGNGVFHIHPLASLTSGAVTAETARRGLPVHPSIRHGYAETAAAPAPAAALDVPDWNL